MSHNSGKAVLALFAGAAIGAAIGILFAPDKGEETRSKIKGNYDDKKKDLKNKYDDLSTKFRKKLSSVDLEASFDDLVANVDEKTSDVIATLERKLQELKQAAGSLKK